MVIPYGRQDISEDDIAAVVAALRSDFLTQGPLVPRFESRMAAYTGAAHAVAVNSATSALHLACLALGVGPGDVVWTSPITFVASANCALYCGAGVDFVDIDPVTCNMSPDALAARLEVAEKSGRLPKAVIPVHLSGEPCDMAAIGALARRYGFAVIEDASHAIGGRYAGDAIGRCRHSDITVFSFHPVKIITTGEGGLATTNRADLGDKMALLRSHGITRDADQMTEPPHGPWYYQQVALGYNYRMTDLQAALGLSQMDRLDEFIARRHALARRYDELLADLPLRLPRRDSRNLSALHLYIVRRDASRTKRSHGEIFAALRAAGIGVNLHYIPVYRQPYYRSLGFAAGHCPHAEAYYEEAITLPLYPGLTTDEQDRVVNSLQEALR